MEPFYEPYRHLSEKDHTIYNEFMRVFDALLFGEDQSISLEIKRSGKYYCNLSILEVHKRSNKSFNLHYVLEKKQFVVESLYPLFLEAKSKKLYNSIRKLQLSGKYKKFLV